MSDDIRVLNELLEIIWGSKPKKVKTKRPRNKRGRYIKRSEK